MKKSFNPLVSIIIPVFNGQNYLKEAIDSALAQTYDNIEIIVVNDGSTDRTEEIAKSYSKKIKYYKKNNGGVSSALNLAIEKSNGKYISWLSHDDVYYPEKIEKQINLLSELIGHSRENTVLLSNYSLINDKSELMFVQQFQEIHEEKKLNNPLYLLTNGLIHGCTLLLPKKIFEENNKFDESLKATQDYDLWFDVFPKYNIFFMKDVLVKSRCHQDQGSKKIDSSKECDSLWIKMMDGISDKEKANISGSIPSFYKKIYKLTKNAGYSGAAKHALKVINRYKKVDRSKIKISIIIPFYNRIKWTIESIKSVIDQDHKNIEIILINDASTENIKAINDIAKKEKRIKLITNKKNLGSAKSRNIGIEQSTGEFITFLDSDDLYLKNKLSYQLNFMIENLVDFSHTSYRLFSNNRTIKRVNSGRNNYLYPEIISGCSIATPTVMVNSKILKLNKIKFPEKYKYGEDICTWIDLSKKTNIYGIEKILVDVRVHDENAAYDVKKQIIGLRNIYNFVYDTSLDKRSIEKLVDLHKLLMNYIRIDLGISENISFTKKPISPFKKFFILSFYKIDKLVPKSIRLKYKKKILENKIFKKILDN